VIITVSFTYEKAAVVWEPEQRECSSLYGECCVVKESIGCLWRPAGDEHRELFVIPSYERP
jgi:hypothetical protein